MTIGILYMARPRDRYLVALACTAGCAVRSGHAPLATETAMRRILPLLTVLCLGFAPAPFPRPIRGELKALQGQWEQIRYQGRSPGLNGPEVFVFRGNHLIHRKRSWRVRIDPSHSPKVLDLKEPGTMSGAKVTLQGIYKLEGDTLTFCYRDETGSGGRLSAFDTSSPATHLHVLKRKTR